MAQAQSLSQGHLSVPVLLEEGNGGLDLCGAKLHPLAPYLDEGDLEAGQLGELGLGEDIAA